MIKQIMKAGVVIGIVGLSAGAQAAPAGVQLRMSAKDYQDLIDAPKGEGDAAARLMLSRPSSAEAVVEVSRLMSLRGSDDYSHLGTITLMAQNAKIIEQNDRIIALLEKIADKK